MKGLNQVIALMLAATLAGCSSEPSKAELIGRYVLNGHGQSSSVVINANGTYDHSWQAGGKLLHQSSTWTDDGVVQEDFFAQCRRVTLENFESQSGRGFWPACIEKSPLGAITIPFDEDLGLYYAKQ